MNNCISHSILFVVWENKVWVSSKSPMAPSKVFQIILDIAKSIEVFPLRRAQDVDFLLSAGSEIKADFTLSMQAFESLLDVIITVVFSSVCLHEPCVAYPDSCLHVPGIHHVLQRLRSLGVHHCHTHEPCTNTHTHPISCTRDSQRSTSILVQLSSCTLVR